MNSPQDTGMKKKLGSIVCLLIASISLTTAHTVQLQYSHSSPQAIYAAQRLTRTLAASGYSIREGKTEYAITLSIDSTELSAEAFVISPAGTTITVKGGNGAGLIYGALSIAEDINNGIRLGKLSPKQESAALPFRAIKFDLPWDTYRHSASLDQHKETCRDLKYWEAFLDMMVENRFNTLTL
jgi:hypothetical protein